MNNWNDGVRLGLQPSIVLEAGLNMGETEDPEPWVNLGVDLFECDEGCREYATLKISKRK